MHKNNPLIMEPLESKAGGSRVRRKSIFASYFLYTVKNFNCKVFNKIKKYWMRKLLVQEKKSTLFHLSSVVAY